VKALLAGETDSEPHIMGQIEIVKDPCNPSWRYSSRIISTFSFSHVHRSYRLIDDTVQFFDFATEVCDSTMEYIEVDIYLT
jgi:hypothetical protein